MKGQRKSSAKDLMKYNPQMQLTSHLRNQISRDDFTAVPREKDTGERFPRIVLTRLGLSVREKKFDDPVQMGTD